MIWVNYHVKVDGSLKDALYNAFDVYIATGMKPDSIDFDGMALKFDERDASSVHLGDLSTNEYIRRHKIERVLSDSEESD